MIQRYTTPELSEVWSESSRWKLFVRLEALFLKALEKRGIAAPGGAEVLGRLDPDPVRIAEIERETGHEVVAFIKACEELAPPGTLRYIHYGLTSSDIMDTVFSLQLVKAGRLIEKELKSVIGLLREKALLYKGLPIIGRTHGIHAEPTSLGLVFLGFFNEFQRHERRLESALNDVSVGKLSGAVGTHASTDPLIEEEVLTELGLRPEECATQVVARDRYSHFFCTLAGLGGGIERLATTIRHLQRTEVGEIFEPFGRRQTGSSAMPHKRNPVLSENLCGLARLLRSYCVASLENQALWMERDISHSSVERVIGPDATTVAHFALRRLARILEGLEINKDAMRRNLELTGGAWSSGCLLLKLISSGLTRTQAYEIVQDAAKQAVQAGRGFQEVVMGNEEVLKHIGPEDISECFDPEAYLKNEGVLFSRSGITGREK